jgi:hypothetical protein
LIAALVGGAVLLGEDNSALVITAKPGDSMHYQSPVMGYI